VSDQPSSQCPFPSGSVGNGLNGLAAAPSIPFVAAPPILDVAARDALKAFRFKLLFDLGTPVPIASIVPKLATGSAFGTFGSIGTMSSISAIARAIEMNSATVLISPTTFGIIGRAHIERGTCEAGETLRAPRACRTELG
jgi:hypothetical protein